ncbi:MAG: DMT family transporter [Proteobacteria bacterium]|nr:DMT family transporter [Pseudomonadota bacterium]
MSETALNAPASARERWIRRTWIWAVMLFCGGIWGLVPTLAKTAIQDGAHPIGLTWWQGIGGGVLLLVFNLLRGKRLPLDRRHLLFYGFCGLFGTIMPTMALFYAAPHVPAGVMAILMSAVPIGAYVFALVLRIDRLEWLRSLGIALGIVGVALLVLPGSNGGVSPWWALVALLIPLGYAAENIFVALRSPRQTGTTILVCGMVLTGGILITPVMLATGTFYPIAFPLTDAALSIGAIIVVNVLSYAAFLLLIYAAGPVFASMSGYFTVLSGILWGVVFLGEGHGAIFWVALATMFVGMAMVRERAVAMAPAAAKP